MNARSISVVVAACVLIAVNLYLIKIERIAPSADAAISELHAVDRLLDTRFVRANRQSNFESFGMSPEMAAEAVQHTGHLEDLHKEKLRMVMADAPDPIALADALCGQTRQVRPRYGALRLLVEERGGGRRPLNLKRFTSFTKQDWASVSSIDAVYNQLELSSDRHEDATLMGIAAILTSQEQRVLDHMKPWGRGLALGTWDWSAVKSEFGGVRELLVTYFATMHLVVEVAVAEDGICGD